MQAVLAVHPPPADDVEALVELVEEPGDVGRVVLRIAVKGDDDAAAGEVEAGRHRGRLPEVPPELDHLHPMVAVCNRRYAGEGQIATSIVDEDDLERAVEPLERLEQSLVERLHRLLLVEDGNHD